MTCGTCALNLPFPNMFAVLRGLRRPGEPASLRLRDRIGAIRPTRSDAAAPAAPKQKARAATGPGLQAIPAIPLRDR